MISNYLGTLKELRNYADGLIVTDETGKIVFFEIYNRNICDVNEEDFIGKTILDLYPSMQKAESTIYKALTKGESTFNEAQRLVTYNGFVTNFLSDTFPIVEDKKIIGCINITKCIDQENLKNYVNISSMTTKSRDELYNINDIITCSEKMEELKQKILMVSQTNSSVLICGETGTGKELFAQSIHSSSSRSGKPFVSQNCAAVPDSLLEAIFFGTVKGSFTGAENRPGIFEVADGGTIFLDEMNSMSLNMQAKLLKVIEEKKVTRIGTFEPKKIDVRIITAMNESPMKCMLENKLREDIFYRLASVQLTIPPLRERVEDIEFLINYYINLNNKEMNKDIKGLDNDLLESFKNYYWPGNVRELKNIIEGAFNFLSVGLISKKHLPEYINDALSSNSSASSKQSTDISSLGEETLKDALDDYEKKFIESKISSVKSLSELAEKLNISRQTLNYKLNKYNINRF